MLTHFWTKKKCLITEGNGHPMVKYIYIYNIIYIYIMHYYIYIHMNSLNIIELALRLDAWQTVWKAWSWMRIMENTSSQSQVLNFLSPKDHPRIIHSWNMKHLCKWIHRWLIDKLPRNWLNSGGSGSEAGTPRHALGLTGCSVSWAWEIVLLIHWYIASIGTSILCVVPSEPVTVLSKFIHINPHLPRAKIIQVGWSPGDASMISWWVWLVL